MFRPVLKPSTLLPHEDFQVHRAAVDGIWDAAGRRHAVRPPLLGNPRTETRTRGLAKQLEGYTAAHPFLVVSDGFPEGFIPRPTAPDFILGFKTDPSQRKRA